MNHIIESIFKEDISSPQELQRVVDAFEPVTFKKKAYLFTPNQLISHYYFVDTGFARSFAIDLEGNEITTDFFSHAQIIIDWPAFFMRSSTNEYYQAITDLTGYKIGFDKFQELFHSITGFRESGRSRLVRSFYLMKKRHNDLITKPATERYLTLLKNHPEILENASLKDISSYLGITDTSLSRIRKDLTR